MKTVVLGLVAQNWSEVKCFQFLSMDSFSSKLLGRLQGEEGKIIFKLLRSMEELRSPGGYSTREGSPRVGGGWVSPVGSPRYHRGYLEVD